MLDVFSVSGCIVSLNWLLHAICYYLQELHFVDVSSCLSVCDVCQELDDVNNV